jgi:hypothetical protein
LMGTFTPYTRPPASTGDWYPHGPGEACSTFEMVSLACDNLNAINAKYQRRITILTRVEDRLTGS